MLIYDGLRVSRPGRWVGAQPGTALWSAVPAPRRPATGTRAAVPASLTRPGLGLAEERAQSEKKSGADER
jgi:hypothetical protein